MSSFAHRFLGRAQFLCRRNSRIALNWLAKGGRRDERHPAINSELQSGWRITMPELSRIGVSLEDDLLKEFYRLIAKRGYETRSEAFRDLIREKLLSEMVESNKPVVGTLTIVYDHHVPNLAQKLTEVQHHAGAMILATTHIHLDHHYCLEVIIMKGRGKDLRAVANGMLALRGVELGKLVLTNSGASLKHATHSH
jgi:CopG family nickel-responsive transcriptional regulator